MGSSPVLVSLLVLLVVSPRLVSGVVAVMDTPTVVSSSEVVVDVVTPVVAGESSSVGSSPLLLPVEPVLPPPPGVVASSPQLESHARATIIVELSVFIGPEASRAGPTEIERFELRTRGGRTIVVGCW